MEKSKCFYPDIIRNLPDAKIDFKGVKGKLLQGSNSQLVFMEIEPIGEVSPHKHGAQWGVVLDGEMKLTIDGVTKVYKKGDSYFIPAGIVHSAAFDVKVHVLDYFDDRERYKAIKALKQS